MAKHRIRRWFQFGVLDLLVLTTIVAVAAFLWRPVQPKVNKARPLLFGIWKAAQAEVQLLPDLYYRVVVADDIDAGTPWTLRSIKSGKDEFLLTCGKQQFVVRSESGSPTLDLLTADGSAKSRLRQRARFDGPIQANLPHGTWTLKSEDDPSPYATMAFRDGELVDYHSHGERFLVGLNYLRGLRGLPELTASDFPADSAPAETPHE